MSKRPELEPRPDEVMGAVKVHAWLEQMAHWLPATSPRGWAARVSVKIAAHMLGKELARARTRRR
jgi:hypothetical protein